MRYCEESYAESFLFYFTLYSRTQYENVKMQIKKNVTFLAQ
jgi:hypothetical protein